MQAYRVHAIGLMIGLLSLAPFELPAAQPAPGKSEAAASARALLQSGKYAEAEEAFEKLNDEQAVDRALGVARRQNATGRREKAADTLETALAKHPQAAALPAELAQLALERGDYPAAERHAAAALKIDSDQVLARWVEAELHQAAGRLAEADAGYKWLVSYFNEHDSLDAETLLWIGRGAAQYARWNRLSDQFGFLVNEFYPDVLKADASCWQARHAAGQLFAEKYNEADAGKEFKAALELNPNAAELHVAIGRVALDGFELSDALAVCDEALSVNEQFLPALQLKADIHLANFEPRQAAGVLGDALKLHPTSEETLGRLAATYLAVDGIAQSGPGSRFDKLTAQVNARNPHAGRYYVALADSLDHLRRWPAAAGYYREAIQRMPQLGAARGSLGLVLMRLGEEDEAKKVLSESFEADPFNVRVNNSIKVLEVLEGYATHETEHFLIKHDPQKDKVLAQYMGRWLEQVYPQLVEQMGFAPPQKSLFEVFSKAKNTDGHGWFSARMVGLPHIHPIGACAGKIVALQSPSEGQQRFNWARVLKHEFVHVINLQQTDFNIPHWFTEALAVLNEGYDRPADWNDLLAANSAKGKLFNLDTINLGFIRPHSSTEWTLAYCQAELYAEYMVERFGPTAIAKMLTAYADNLTTPEAIQRSFDVNQADFEAGYQKFVHEVVANWPAPAASEQSLPELQKALAGSPKDPTLLARLAFAQLGRKNYPEARRAADAAVAGEPQNGLANYVRARLHLVVGENQEALARLEGALDRQHPQENLLGLLAGLKLKSEDYETAAELYQLGAKHFPHDAKWQKSLAAVYLKNGDEKRLLPVLVKLAELDPDDLSLRKKLAQLAIASRDFQAASRWTLEGLWIQVQDVELHQWRAQALAALDDPAGAADEFGMLAQLQPGVAKWPLAQAKALIQARQPAEAKRVLDELLKQSPNDPGAKTLRESLE